MYEAAREFLGHGVSQGPQGRSSGAQALADRGSKQNHMAIAAPEEGVTPEAALRASAEFTKLSVPGGDQIEDGSGSGEGLASPSAVDDDPFSFLNEDRPLVRKPAVDVIRPAGGAPASSLAHPALAHAHLVEVDSGGEVVLPAEDEIGAGPRQGELSSTGVDAREREPGCSHGSHRADCFPTDHAITDGPDRGWCRFFGPGHVAQ